MNKMTTLNEFLKEKNANTYLYEFAKDLTLEQFHTTCPRGDWLLWLFKQLQPTKKNELRLAAAHCANTVRPSMKDKRSTDIIDYIIKNNGKKPPLKLIQGAAAAYAATGYAEASFAASASSFAASSSVYAAADAAAAADAYADANAYAYAAKKENQELTAKICKEILPLPIWGELP
jgi:hypothetical protein